MWRAGPEQVELDRNTARMVSALLVGWEEELSPGCKGAAAEPLLGHKAPAPSSAAANKPSGTAYFNCIVPWRRAGRRRGCPTFLHRGIWSGIIVPGQGRQVLSIFALLGLCRQGKVMRAVEEGVKPRELLSLAVPCPSPAACPRACRGEVSGVACHPALPPAPRGWQAVS